MFELGVVNNRFKTKTKRFNIYSGKLANPQTGRVYACSTSAH